VKLLVAILVVAQAAGPWLCCCVPTQLVARAKAQVETVEAHVCRHCKPAAKLPRKAACCESAPQPKSPPSDCCEHCGRQLVPEPAIVPPPVSLQTLPEQPGEFLTVAESGLTSPQAPAAGEEHPPPFFPVEAKLYAHHVLRC
jgi:hypothetical protein